MFTRRLRTTIILGGLMSALCACGASAPPPAAPAADTEVVDDRGSAPEQQAAPAKPIDEIDADEVWDRQIEAACAEGRFPEFLNAFVRSPSVARHYTASRLSMVRAGSRTEVRGAGYGGAPITLMDHRWVTAASAARGAPFERVELQINQSADNRVLVEWRPVVYGPPGPDEEDGEILRQTGPAGALLFAPTAHCWELVEDRIRSEGS